MSGHSSVAEPQLNATPLIDVMLVLLVILIITLPVATHAVKLNLPQGHAAAPPPSIRVDIASDGAIYWNGDDVASLEQLSARFATVAAQRERAAHQRRAGKARALRTRRAGAGAGPALAGRPR